MNLASYFDHTNLNPSASRKDISRLCEEARQHGFFSVCIHPCHLAQAKELLQGTEVRLTTVVGFPLGQNTARVKAYETLEALAAGADEIDMVMNYGALKEGLFDLVLEDLLAVRKACPGHVLKVILETSELSDEEIEQACRLCLEAKADFVKTSTGFRGGGATAEDVSRMKNVFRGKVKASGGVRTLEQAQQMIAAGADRLGSSSGVAIMEEVS